MDSKICPCCQIEHDLVDLIYIDNVYKCTICIKNERQQKSDEWLAVKEASVLIIQNILTEIDSISVLDKNLMLRKFRDINDVLIVMQNYVQ